MALGEKQQAQEDLRGMIRGLASQRIHLIRMRDRPEILEERRLELRKVIDKAQIELAKLDLEFGDIDGKVDALDERIKELQNRYLVEKHRKKLERLARLEKAVNGEEE